MKENMEQQLELDDVIKQNITLSKELWQLKSYIAQREIHIIELNQMIYDLNKQLSSNTTIEQKNDNGT